MKRLIAVLFQRCPVCLEGKVFKSLLGTNTNCPVCGIKFERETGYFLNAMFIAYTMGFLLVIPLAVLLYLWNASILLFTIVIIGFFVVAWPLFFRYSRILWMHADQLMDPRPRQSKIADATHLQDALHFASPPVDPSTGMSQVATMSAPVDITSTTITSPK